MDRYRLPKLPKFRHSLGSLQNRLSSPTPAKADRLLPLRTTGPRELHLQTQPVSTKGPGEPPAGWSGAFPGGASTDEWYVYFGIAKVLNDPKDPRQPPFTGGHTWTYQKAVDGGRLIRGGQVVDFAVTLGGRNVAIRVMTERWHAAAEREQKARDLRGKVQLSRYHRVCDLWSQNFLGDPTGEAVCRNVADCLKGRTTPDPFTWGFRRVRRDT